MTARGATIDSDLASRTALPYDLKFHRPSKYAISHNFMKHLVAFDSISTSRAENRETLMEPLDLVSRLCSRPRSIINASSSSSQ